MAVEAFARTQNHEQDGNDVEHNDVEHNGDIPVLKAVVQSGDLDLIKSARQSCEQPAEINDDQGDESAAFKTFSDHSDIEDTPGMVCESDLEQTIEAIITQHVNSMRAEIKAVLWLHTETRANDDS